MLRFIGISLCTVLVASCSTGNLTAINQSRAITSGNTGSHGIFIDAKQRVILSVNRPVNGDIPARLIVCAEPSPDALSAIAAQAGVSVSQLSQAVTAQGGLSETAANIGLRTQTIQILRDGFYRLCEAQMNGLSDIQYTIMLRRFQVNMIALLSIEQLTGTVRGSDALVSASAGAALDFRETYSQRSLLASQKLIEIEQALSEVSKRLLEIEAELEACKGDACTDAERASLRLEKQKLNIERDSLDKQKKSAEYVQSTNQELAKTAPSSSSGQGGGVLIASLQGQSNAKLVADAVKEITLAIIQQDHGMQLCFDYAMAGGTTYANVRKLCASVFQLYINQHNDRIAAQASLRSVLQSLSQQIQSNVESGQSNEELLGSLDSVLEAQRMFIESASGGLMSLQSHRPERLIEE